MKDDALVKDLKSVKYPESKIDTLRQAGIATYSHLLSLLSDDTIQPELRVELCTMLSSLFRNVDKRQVVHPLLAALNSNDLALRSTAARACGMMSLKRAI